MTISKRCIFEEATRSQTDIYGGILMLFKEVLGFDLGSSWGSQAKQKQLDKIQNKI